MKSNHSLLALTALELLVVVSLVAIVIALLIPGLTNVRNVTQSVTCVNNLRQLHVAAASYSQERNGALPRFDVYYLDIRDYVTPNVQYAHEECPPTIATCPTQFAQKASWCIIAHTYAMNYLTGDRGSYKDGPPSWNSITNLSKCAHFMDGFSLSDVPQAGIRYWYAAFAFPPPLPGNNNVTNIKFPHKKKNHVVYMDGHVSPLSQSDLEEITNPATPRYSEFWGKYK